jgi:hypothetical protein
MRAIPELPAVFNDGDLIMDIIHKTTLLVAKIHFSADKEDTKKIIQEVGLLVLDVVNDYVIGKGLDKSSSKFFQNWSDVHAKFTKKLSNLSLTVKGAEIIVEGLNTYGQIDALFNSRILKGTKKDTTLTFNNTFKKVERFSDFPSNSRYYPSLHDLEVKGFKFPAQNWAVVDEPEKFGADERVKKREFFATIKQIIKKTRLDANKSYADIYNYDNFNNSTFIDNSDIFYLADMVLSKAFGDEYYSCVNKDWRKAATRIIKKEDLFDGGALPDMKNLYKADVFSYNRMPTDKKKYTQIQLTREESLELYSKLYKAIQRGKNKGCSV